MTFVWETLKQLKDYRTFKETLEVVKEVNTYRSKKGYNSFGFENLILLFLQKKLLDSTFSFLAGQSIKNIVESHDEYNKRKELFKITEKRFIQPDITILDRGKIQEIYEIKVEEDGKINFFLAKDGETNKKDKCKKGDFYRLLKIKQAFPEIKTYGIIVSILFRNSSLPESLQIPESCGGGCVKVREHIREIEHFTFLDYFRFDLLEIC